MLERFRRTGIRLDREGRFWHEGGEITHQRFRVALLSWLDVLDDGRTIFRLDENRYAYVDVDDAHLLVTSARWEDDRAYIALNDETAQELEYDSLQVDPNDDAMYCKVRGGKLTARLATPAYYALADHIVQRDGGFALNAAGRSFVIGERNR